MLRPVLGVVEEAFHVFARDRRIVGDRINQLNASGAAIVKRGLRSYDTQMRT
jgi:hypothetical protein